MTIKKLNPDLRWRFAERGMRDSEGGYGFPDCGPEMGAYLDKLQRLKLSEPEARIAALERELEDRMDEIDAASWYVSQAVNNVGSNHLGHTLAAFSHIPWCKESQRERLMHHAALQGEIHPTVLYKPDFELQYAPDEAPVVPRDPSKVYKPEWRRIPPWDRPAAEQGVQPLAYARIRDAANADNITVLCAELALLPGLPGGVVDALAALSGRAAPCPTDTTAAEE